MEFATPFKRRLTIANYSRQYFGRWRDNPVFCEYRLLNRNRWAARKRIERLEARLAAAREAYVDICRRYAKAQRKFAAVRASMAKQRPDTALASRPGGKRQQ